MKKFEGNLAEKTWPPALAESPDKHHPGNHRKGGRDSTQEPLAFPASHFTTKCVGRALPQYQEIPFQSLWAL